MPSRAEWPPEVQAEARRLLQAATTQASKLVRRKKLPSSQVAVLIRLNAGPASVQQKVQALMLLSDIFASVAAYVVRRHLRESAAQRKNVTSEKRALR